MRPPRGQKPSYERTTPTCEIRLRLAHFSQQFLLDCGFGTMQGHVLLWRHYLYSSTGLPKDILALVLQYAPPLTAIHVVYSLCSDDDRVFVLNTGEWHDERSDERFDQTIKSHHSLYVQSFRRTCRVQLLAVVTHTGPLDMVQFWNRLKNLGVGETHPSTTVASTINGLLMSLEYQCLNRSAAK